MFQNLIGRKINHAFIRLMIFVYLYQRCYVKWQSARSYSFGVTNGTRQGSIFSPRGGFNTYLDPMIESLRRSGYGCTIGKHFFGAVAYADDVLIMATSVQGLQEMVNICQEHATENSLMFSTDIDPKKSKTMCIAFNCTHRTDLAHVKLNGDNLPWVQKAKHIGNFLHEDGSTDTDLRVKKGIFIQTAMELNQEFSSLPAHIRWRMNMLYNSHLSGSNIWKFNSYEASHLVSSWNKNIKVIFELPWATHRWVLEEITRSNLKFILYARFIKFINSIHKSSKPAVRFLYSMVASDVRSMTGSNLRSILLHTGVHVVPGTQQGYLIKKQRCFKVPETDEWKVPLLHSLLQIKAGDFEIKFDENDADDDDNMDIPDDILANICTS